MEERERMMCIREGRFSSESFIAKFVLARILRYDVLKGGGNIEEDGEIRFTAAGSRCVAIIDREFYGDV